MGNLFRSLLAALGGKGSDSPNPPAEDPGQGPADVPFQAAFRVPGMT
jgi:hypothetical protein